MMFPFLVLHTIRWQKNGNLNSNYVLHCPPRWTSTLGILRTWYCAFITFLPLGPKISSSCAEVFTHITPFLAPHAYLTTRTIEGHIFWTPFLSKWNYGYASHRFLSPLNFSGFARAFWRGISISSIIDFLILSICKAISYAFATGLSKRSSTTK